MSSRTEKLSTNSLFTKNVFCYMHMTKEQTSLRISFASIEHTEEYLEKENRHLSMCALVKHARIKKESFVMGGGGGGRSSFDNGYSTVDKGPYQYS